MAQTKHKKSTCRECGGELEIQGIGEFGDTIVVECKTCNEGYEVELDGLEQGELGMIEAVLKTQGDD